MAGYLLFIPGGDPHRQSTQVLADVGLGGLCDDDKADLVPVSVGPGGVGGALLSWQTFAGAPQFAYLPDSQVWQSMAGGAWWFGRQKDSPITPADVARRKQYTGLNCTLRDGNDWSIPITASLPRVWGLDEHGAFSRVIAPEFREYCELSAGVFQSLMSASQSIDSGESAAVAVAGAWEYLCRALALNYRLCPELVAALGLIDDSNFAYALSTSCEFDLIAQVEAQKKTASEVSTPAT